MARFVPFLLCPSLVHLNQRAAFRIGGKYHALSKNSSQASQSFPPLGAVPIFDDRGLFWTQQVAFDPRRCTWSQWDRAGEDAEKEHGF